MSEGKLDFDLFLRKRVMGRPRILTHIINVFCRQFEADNVKLDGTKWVAAKHVVNSCTVKGCKTQEPVHIMSITDSWLKSSSPLHLTEITDRSFSCCIPLTWTLRPKGCALAQTSVFIYPLLRKYLCSGSIMTTPRFSPSSSAFY